MLLEDSWPALVSGIYELVSRVWSVSLSITISMVSRVPVLVFRRNTFIIFPLDNVLTIFFSNRMTWWIIDCGSMDMINERDRGSSESKYCTSGVSLGVGNKGERAKVLSERISFFLNLQSLMIDTSTSPIILEQHANSSPNPRWSWNQQKCQLPYKFLKRNALFRLKPCSNDPVKFR